MRRSCVSHVNLQALGRNLVENKSQEGYNKCVLLTIGSVEFADISTIIRLFGITPFDYSESICKHHFVANSR